MAEVVGQLFGAATFTPDEVAAFPRVRWFVGSGPPSDAVGVNGDLYLDQAAGDIYEKEAGTWL